jgi:hypothetical protein
MHDQPNVPYGHCECGCGRKTTIYRREPRRFIQGHSGNKGKSIDLDGAWLVDGSTGCWLWQRCIDRGGYGQMGKSTAHRYVFNLYRGAIPDGLHIDHLCRVRHCVNPSHMELVSPTENVRRGKVAKVTPDRVRDMRARVVTGEWTIAQAGAAHGLTYYQAWNIIRRKSWKDID